MELLSSKRQEAERGVSVQQVIESLQDTSLKEIVVFAFDEDDTPLVAYSHDDRIRILGMLEILKQQLIDEINYPEI
jgi:hypothetical protein